jgi:predicted metal-dependent hydrolase
MSQTPKIDRIVHSRRKTIAILVTPDGQLEVRAPHGVSRRQIEAIVTQKAAWIQNNRERALKTASLTQRRPLQAGCHLWYLGKSYPLRVNSSAPARVVFDNGFSLPEASLPRAAELLEDWYKKQARAIITARVAYFERTFGLKVRSIRITSARTRWGSCSHLNMLNFTWRLVMAPAGVIDYIVAHEMAHLVEKNHSRAFWAQVEHMLPDYKLYRAWLKANGRFLDLTIEADETKLATVKT